MRHNNTTILNPLAKFRIQYNVMYAGHNQELASQDFNSSPPGQNDRHFADAFSYAYP